MPAAIALIPKEDAMRSSVIPSSIIHPVNGSTEKSGTRFVMEVKR